MAAPAVTNAANAARPENRLTPERPRFALTSPSTTLDHRLHAARRDLADIALAGRWFAPHYAVPVMRCCGWSGADILSGPSHIAARISQLLPGECFAVVEASGGWAWGYSAHDGYVGYIAETALVEPTDQTHRVTARVALAFAEPSSRAAVCALLPTGALLGGEADGAFLRSNIGFVPLHQVAPAASIADPVQTARLLIGMPYLWGGRGTGGIDCSGLVQLAFSFAGLALPRDSDQQAHAGAPADSPTRAGDLLFFPDHVVLASAADHAIHASGHWMQVVEEPVADIVARLEGPIAHRRILP